MTPAPFCPSICSLSTPYPLTPRPLLPAVAPVDGGNLCGGGSFGDELRGRENGPPSVEPRELGPPHCLLAAVEHAGAGDADDGAGSDGYRGSARVPRADGRFELEARGGQLVDVAPAPIATANAVFRQCAATEADGLHTFTDLGRLVETQLERRDADELALENEHCDV